MKVHLDTDFGGDIDDLCALALLLRMSRDIQIMGVTTTAEISGRRAGYVRYVLNLEGREDVLVKSGADVSEGYYRDELGLLPEERYWPEAIDALPNPVGEAVQLLKKSIEQGSLIIGIGPYTNFYLLEKQFPGILSEAQLFLMGGFVYPPRPGFPSWGNDMDFNIQVDIKSAKFVLENSNPTLIPLSITIETSLRRAYLKPLRTSGALGRLIAQQAEQYALDEKHELKYGKTFVGLPDDSINFQHDPLACAVATGWNEGIEIEEIPLIIEEIGGWLVERIHPSGKPIRVVTKVNGPKFNEFWLKEVTNPKMES